MTKAIQKILYCLSAICLSSTAMADQHTDSGIYLSGSIGQNRIQSGIPEENTAFLKIAAGWQLNPNIAVEVGYSDFGKFPGPTPAFTDFDLTGLSASLIGSMPISPALAVFAKAGQVWWSADSDFFFFGRNSGVNQTGTLNFSEADLFLGLGISYEFTDAIEFELEYNRYEFEFPSYSTFDNKNSAAVLSIKFEL